MEDRKSLREKYIFKPMRKESKRILEKDLNAFSSFIAEPRKRRLQ